MNVLLRVLKIAVRHKRRASGAYLCMAGATATYLLLPHLFGKVIDKLALMFSEGVVSDQVILLTVTLIVLVGSLRGILSFGQNYLGESLAQVTVADLRHLYYDRVQNLSFSFHDSFHTGNLMSRAILDMEAIRMFVNVGVVRLPYFLALFILVPVVLTRLDWQLGLVSVSFMPLVAVFIGFIRLRLRKIWIEVQRKMAELNAVLQENLTGVRVVKAFASEAYEAKKFNSKSLDVTQDLMKTTRLDGLNASVIVTTYLGSIGLILWLGGGKVIDGSMTPGELAQFLFYMQIMAVPVRHAGLIVGNIARAISASERLFEVIDTQPAVQDLPGAVPVARIQGRVSFDGVSFGYSTQLPALKNISLEAEPGQVVALVGPPGSGKTTMVHLIPRFYDVLEGCLLIDGVDVRNITLESLRQNIGLVQQDVFLFTASVSENIAYGKVNASRQEIVEAARIAQLDDFIQTMKDGYDTVIGERGNTLSGGQRQRLSIARALMLDPPILILDDATSSVDAETENQIRLAMEHVMRGRTSFVIAHRLSTVHRADLILVLNEGQIVERGTHHELLAANGVYREIYELQIRPQEQVMLDTALSVSDWIEEK